MQITETTINGVVYIVEEHDDGFICKQIKDKGDSFDNISKAKQILSGIQDKQAFLQTDTGKALAGIAQLLLKEDISDI